MNDTPLAQNKRRYLALLLLCANAATGWVFGAEVADHYRWLEDSNSPPVKTWAAAQDKKTQEYLSKVKGQEKLETRLRQLYFVNSVSLPIQAGPRLFYKRILSDREQPIFYWQNPDHPGSEHRWLDPQAFEPKDHVSVGEWIPSPDGNAVAYTTHPEGADQATLHVRLSGHAQDEPKDVIAGADFADVSWTADSQGFYYMRLPVDSAIAPAERVAHADIRYHQMGRDPSLDALIYPPTRDASNYLSPQVSADGRWLFIIAARGWTSNEIYVADRQGSAVHFTTLFKSTTSLADVIAWKGRFYLHTNQNAPRGKVLRKKPQEESWATVIAERPDTTIESMRLVGGYIVLSVLRNASNKVEVYRLEGGKPIWEIPIPEQGKVWDMTGREDQDTLYIDYQSFFVPTVIFRVHLPTRKFEVWDSAELKVDASRFKSELVWYPSKDGTPISMMIVYPKTMKRDGKSRLLLEGYGGFSVAVLPRFSPEVLAWLEMGGIYAAPHLRGGGEYGEAWHQAGMLTKKQNTFDDFTAAAQYLIKEKYTTSDHLAIQGASNGGLLVTAALTQHPELFHAVVCKNPLTDMIRYPLFGEGKAWVPEYGNPENPEELKALSAYSPYHHVVKGTAYPSLLMFAGEHDDRVDPIHARKFVAAVQNANASKHPILFRLLPHSGHATSDHLNTQVQETAERLQFLTKELNVLEQ